MLKVGMVKALLGEWIGVLTLFGQLLALSKRDYCQLCPFKVISLEEQELKLLAFRLICF